VPEVTEVTVGTAVDSNVEMLVLVITVGTEAKLEVSGINVGLVASSTALEKTVEMLLDSGVCTVSSLSVETVAVGEVYWNCIAVTSVFFGALTVVYTGIRVEIVRAPVVYNSSSVL